ncbi:MAG: alcohol dehydrogenase-like regulatory protein ErcA [Syntrophobacteraceae bacterium]
MDDGCQAELRKFVAPEFIYGPGAIDLAGQYAKNFGVRKALLVTDSGITRSGWTQRVLDALKLENISCVVFEEVTPNPKDFEVMAGADLYRAQGCEAIIAVGGGSPMDCAKGIGIVTSNDQHILELEGIDRVPAPGPPLICVPTTAGSSADVSQFAIITDTKRHLKIAIVSKTMVPDVALIDPCTTVTMDQELTACTGMDALCHAFEAYASNANSPVTDLHAIEAVRLISAHLIPAIREPKDLEHRDKMMLASLHAGLAFSNASLGAVHAMAHSLGGLLDTAHGESNAILLSPVVAYNFEAAGERYANIARALGIAESSSHILQVLLDVLDGLRREAGIHRRLGEMGVRPADIPQLASKALADPCMVTNPRRPTQQDIEAIYEQAL